jgi:hypothetical protein
LVVVPRPLPRPLPAATRRCRSRRRTLGELELADWPSSHREFPKKKILRALRFIMRTEYASKTSELGLATPQQPRSVWAKNGGKRAKITEEPEMWSTRMPSKRGRACLPPQKITTRMKALEVSPEQRKMHAQELPQLCLRHLEATRLFDLFLYLPLFSSFLGGGITISSSYLAPTILV